MVHIMVVSVLITVNYCIVFCYLVHCTRTSSTLNIGIKLIIIIIIM